MGQKQFFIDADETGNSEVHNLSGSVNFQAVGDTSAGAGAASIVIEARNHPDAPWTVLDTLTLTLGTTVTADAGVVNGPWAQVRARIASISGTDAKVSLVGYGSF